MVENGDWSQLVKQSWGKEPFETRREMRGADERLEVAVLDMFTHAVKLVKFLRNTLAKNEKNLSRVVECIETCTMPLKPSLYCCAYHILSFKKFFIRITKQRNKIM